MKNISNNSSAMKCIHSFFIPLFLCALSLSSFAQDSETTVIEIKEKKETKPARPAYESAWWFDGQTGVVYKKNSLEFVIQHRFSHINSGEFKDLLGLYGPSTNTRIGLSYVPIDRLSIGFGYTKLKYIVDFNAKYMILQQTRKNEMPISLTYYVNMGLEAQEKENYQNASDRLSYFHQIIVMKRFNKKFSAHIAPSFIHYNVVKQELQESDTYKSLNNDSWGLSFGARYKLSAQIIIMAGFDTPLTQQPLNQPLPSINLGLEIATSNHAFQVFFTNYNKIQAQEDFMFNQNDFIQGQWLIGFNITRIRSL